MSMTIQNHDNAGILLGNNEFQEGLLTHVGAGTIVAGTILGRVTTTNKWEKYDTAAITGEEIPRGILTIDSVAAGAGDESVRVLVKGKVRNEKVIDPNTAVAPTIETQDLLRDHAGIFCETVDELLIQDNQ
jgi:hypothetical protein